MHTIWHKLFKVKRYLQLLSAEFCLQKCVLFNSCSS